MGAGEPVIFTVGHSTHEASVLLDLLEKHGVAAVVDVRSAPYSGRAPHFNREALAEILRSRGIRYAFLGDELGGRSDDPSCFVEGRVQYDRLADKAAFQSAIRKLVSNSRSRQIALLCAEKEPLECHRALLVGQVLHTQGHAVAHILADGRLEPHGDSLLRLRGLTRRGNAELFRTPEETLDDALSIQRQRFAYFDERFASRRREAEA